MKDGQIEWDFLIGIDSLDYRFPFVFLEVVERGREPIMGKQISEAVARSLMQHHRGACINMIQLSLYSNDSKEMFLARLKDGLIEAGLPECYMERYIRYFFRRFKGYRFHKPLPHLPVIHPNSVFLN